MQKAAAWALFSGVIEGAALVARVDQAKSLVESWIESKGVLGSTGDEKRSLTLKDGRIAAFEARRSVLAASVVWDHVLTEPSGDACVRTQVSIGTLGNRLAVYVELQAEGGAYRIGPTRLDIRTPNLVKQIIASAEDWQCGESLVSTRPFAFAGDDDGKILSKALWHPDRNLPVLAVSSYENEHLTPSFAQDLASDLAGVALVAELDPACSWYLTHTRGKEWSSYNGAVRLFWPGLRSGDNPLRHPLWQRDTLRASAPTATEAANRFRSQIRRQLLGISAFSMLEPPEFIEIRRGQAQRELEAARAALRDDDLEGLVSLYSAENRELKAAAATDQQRIVELTAEIAGLKQALQWTPEANVERDISPETSLPPQSVAEAVQMARARFQDDLFFGDDVAEGVKSLAPDAGPPEKILSYLEVLAEMARTRRTTGLKNQMSKWLQARNVACSGESSTTSSSKSERQRRTWDFGGEKRTFDLHLKPSDGVHPDRCARIYFDYDDDRGRAVVGWVGRHL